MKKLVIVNFAVSEICKYTADSKLQIGESVL